MWVASVRSPTFAITGSGLNQNNEGLFVAVDSGYNRKSLGDSFPYIASYYINVADPNNMFKRVPNGWARLEQGTGSIKGKFYYIFKSPTTYFHTVGKKNVNDDPFISRTCLMDEGSDDDPFDPYKYRSYIDIHFR